MPTIHADVCDDPIDVTAVLSAVRRDDAGAVVLFLGTVRSVTGDRRTERLGYEAYAAMASSEMRRAAEEVAAETGVLAAAAVHRVGELSPGDDAVAVAVSSPHRPAAFEAARSLIDRVKASVPIWKREFGHGGVEWVEPDAAGRRFADAQGAAT